MQMLQVEIADETGQSIPHTDMFPNNFSFLALVVLP